jgi:hypothetical protein
VAAPASARRPVCDGRTLSNSAEKSNFIGRFHNSKRTPATMNDEGLADAEAANPFRLPRLHPGSEPTVNFGVPCSTRCDGLVRPQVARLCAERPDILGAGIGQASAADQSPRLPVRISS